MAVRISEGEGPIAQKAAQWEFVNKSHQRVRVWGIAPGTQWIRAVEQLQFLKHLKKNKGIHQEIWLSYSKSTPKHEECPENDILSWGRLWNEWSCRWWNTSLWQLQNCISWTSNLNTISATTLINSLPVILWRDFKLHEGDIYVKSLIAEVRSASYPSSSHNPGWLWQHWNVSSGPLLLTRVLRLGHLVIILSLSFVSVKGHGSSKKLPKINSCDTFRYNQDEPLPKSLQGGCSFCL